MVLDKLLRLGEGKRLKQLWKMVDQVNALEDDVAVGLLTPEKIPVASGYRYLCARRPELYGKLLDPVPDHMQKGTQPGWKLKEPESETSNVKRQT